MTVANAGGNLASYAYSLGAAGNRTQVVENTGRTVNYAYDDLYRLTSETIANSANNGAISYQFDAVGNRLNRTSSVTQIPNQTSTYDANDRLNSDTYDANGSTKVSNGKTYNYDFENHLTSTSDGVTVVYDGEGNRVSKTVGGVTTKYLVDTNNLTGYAQVLEELQSGSVTKQFTYGLDLISQRQNSGASFYNYDGHGSVRGLSNSGGAVTDTYSYDAFGTIIERTGTTDNSYLYAGEQFDLDLGFYYNRARYLNVSTGRFISQDSFEGNKFEPKSLHKYVYADNDSANRLDPTGKISALEEVGALLARAVSFTLAYSHVFVAAGRILTAFTLYNLATNEEFRYNYLAAGLNPAEALAGDFEVLAGSASSLARFPGRISDPVERFSETGNEFASFEAWAVRRDNPQAYINEVIERWGLNRHLAGKEVIYAGEKIGVSGGVQSTSPNTIRIYKEGAERSERYLVETLIEEIHHSKLLGIRPELGNREYNQLWQKIVEPRAKGFAEIYADRLGVPSNGQ
jgi:RHS repeat-associated protein